MELVIGYLVFLSQGAEKEENQNRFSILVKRAIPEMEITDLIK